MSCLGVHFALTNEQVSELRKHDSDEARLGFVKETLEPDFFEKHPESMAECDKAWEDRKSVV